jgi:hypothetical protein
MSPQQKLLWKVITKEVRDLGEGNLRARELYDEFCKIINMSDKVLVSIVEKENGLEVRIGEMAYGNLAIVGLLEKIKLNLLTEVEENKEVFDNINPNSKYDA